MVDALEPIIAEQLAVQLTGQSSPLFRGLSFVVSPGRRLAIVGGSGCGKSTLLGVILGNLAPSEGRLLVGGHEAGSNQAVKWISRNAGVLFQKEALLAGRTVTQNLVFPLQHGAARENRDSRILGQPEALKSLVTAMGLPSDCLHRPVEALSGGQRKRVALARALVRQPSLLLLDEPTSGLDPATTLSIAEHLRGICEQRAMGMLCITHDPKFAETLGCEVIRLDAYSIQGAELVDTSKPAAHSLRPPSAWLTRFVELGLGNALICVPVGLLVGAGLASQSLHGPSWLQSFLPQGVVAGVFLGLGTLVPALLVVGHSGSGIAAEIAQRKSADQLLYFRTIGLSALWYLIVPIFTALVVMMPLLTIASEYAMLRGARLAVELAGEQSRLTGIGFWFVVTEKLNDHPEMIWRSLAKAFTHGASIAIAGLVSGFRAGHGEIQLRRAISASVIGASFLVIVGDVLWSVLWPHRGY